VYQGIGNTASKNMQLLWVSAFGAAFEIYEKQSTCGIGGGSSIVDLAPCHLQ